MFLVIVVGLMLVLPAASVLMEHGRGGAADVLLLAGKWFVFWAVGARLFLAGLRQSIQPGFTAQQLLGITGAECFVVIRELGFANMAIGIVALASLRVPAWTPPAAVAGGLFIGLAGVAHVLRRHRSRLEDVAMVTNLLVVAVLLAYCVRLVRS